MAIVIPNQRGGSFSEDSTSDDVARMPNVSRITLIGRGCKSKTRVPVPSVLVMISVIPGTRCGMNACKISMLKTNTAC
jgi:hypothetical protein